MTPALDVTEAPEEVPPRTELDIRSQLDSMRTMKDGWLEGGGVAPSPGGLDWLAQVFRAYYPDDCPQPYLYPTEDGGVQAEWSLELWTVSWDINLESRSGDWFALNRKTDQAVEKPLRCDEASDWRWLVQQIRELSRGLECRVQPSSGDR